MMNRSESYDKMINSKEWRMLRKRKLMSNPLCQDCYKDGIYEPASEVHHIIPVENGINKTEQKRLMFDFNNLMSLCHSCHVKRHVLLNSHSRKVNEQKNQDNKKWFSKKFLE